MAEPTNPPSHPPLHPHSLHPPTSAPPGRPGPVRSEPAKRNPLAQLAAERTAALVIGALGGGLLVAAAGTFIAISWDRLGLEAKAGLVALLALGALAAGEFLRDRAPGTSSVLTHLGGFLIPIDVGGVATATGLDRAEVGVVAGTVGAVVLTALDGRGLLESRGPTARGRSPFMALGRVLSLGAAGLGLAALLDVAPSIVFAVGALAMLAVRVSLPRVHQRHRFDGVGLAALAGSGPAFALAAEFTQPGSLIDWLSDLMAAEPLTVVVAAALAGALAVLIDRGVPGTSVALVVGALAAPSAVELIADHRTGALVFAAAMVAAARVVLVAGSNGNELRRFIPWLDAASIVTGAIAILVALANVGPSATPEVGVLASAALLAAGWLLSDLESGARLGNEGPSLSSLMRGATGPISTIGLVGTSIAASIALADFDHGALLLAVVSAGLGLAPRPGATVVARFGPIGATIVAFGNPWLALSIGLSAALLLQGRALMDFGNGVGPRLARTTQWFGLMSLALAVLRFTGSAVEIADHWQLMASVLVATVLALLAVSADQLPVPDLRLAPRVATPLLLLPLVGHPEAIGMTALGCAVTLFLDRIHNQQLGADVMASVHLVLGSWVLAASQGIEAAEAYVAAPAAVLLWFGVRATLAGASSWIGIAPGLSLLGLVTLLERAATGDGWHGALAGTVGLAAMAIGVERRWSAPTTIGTGLLVATVTIEGAAVIPQLPVWVLLAVGGSLLLTMGFLLERRAGSGATASLRTTWQMFN